MSEHRRANPHAQRRRGPGGGPPGGGPHGMMPGEKAKDFKGTMVKLVKYLGAYKWAVLFVWALAITSTVLGILGPDRLGNAIDVLFSGVMQKIAGTGEVDFAALLRIMLQLMGLYGVSALLSYGQGFFMSGVTMKLTRRLRAELDHKIHCLPLKFYDTMTTGEVLSRITNDVDTVSQSLNQSLTQIVTSVVSVVGTVIIMLTISWRMTLVTLMMLPLTMLLVTTIVKKSQKHFKHQQEYLGNVNGHVEEMYGSHVVVKAFCGEADSIKTFEESSDKLYDAQWRANFLSGLMMPATGMVGNLGYVAICILGGYLATVGQMTVGGIAKFIQYVRNFNHPISQLANISNVLQQTAAAAERVFEFLDETNEPADVEHPVSPDNVLGDVAFEHVRFGYSPDKIIINDFSASIESGHKIAIVGPTGAGKTTIVKLLMRFYDVIEGAILVDGHDIRQFTREGLRSLFGMVLQDTWLFSGSIADNIRYGKLDATLDEVVAAAKAAQVDHFVRTLPEGYDMVLNEEASNVSQGQKQLLTIARAILADPKILILDEATSSVDTRTEILIQKAMDNLMHGRTSFVIAHRLSTVRNADLILAMRDGDIVEQGTHEELLAENGFYAQLYYSQFENAQESA